MNGTHDPAQLPLAGRTALVTGGGRGLGEAICEELARNGAHVVVADLDGDRAAAVAQRLTRHGVKAVGRPLDVRDEASVLQAVHDAREVVGDLDVIVNNAAIDVTAPIDDVSDCPAVPLKAKVPRHTSLSPPAQFMYEPLMVPA